MKKPSLNEGDLECSATYTVAEVSITVQYMQIMQNSWASCKFQAHDKSKIIYRYTYTNSPGCVHCGDKENQGHQQGNGQVQMDIEQRTLVEGLPVSEEEIKSWYLFLWVTKKEGLFEPVELSRWWHYLRSLHSIARACACSLCRAELKQVRTSRVRSKVLMVFS